MKKLCILFVAFAAAKAFAQKQIKPLAVGDKCPDLILQSIINSPLKSAKLSSFKGKLVILDFMGTFCTTCINNLPLFDSLQKRFGNRMQIIPVTRQKKELVQNLLNRKFMQGNSLPFVVEDRELSAHFPHAYLPHEAWIDGNGIVKAITSEQYITAANIEAVVRGEKINWPTKIDRDDIADALPLLVPNPAALPLPQPRYYAMLSPFMEGVLGNSVQVTDSANNTIAFYMKNREIIPLYMLALQVAGKKVSAAAKNLLVEVKDSSRFFYNSKKEYRDEWNRKNAYCYEAVLPLNSPAQIRAEWIISDLNRYLGLQAGLEQRTKPCWVVKKLPASGYTDSTCAGKQVSNKKRRIGTIDELIKHLNYEPQLPLLINETGTAIDVKEEPNMEALKNKQALEDFLSRYGLCLQEEPRQVEVFVIRD